MSLKPEERAEVILWDWLRKYGNVFFNRQNKLSEKIFNIKGKTKEIPDFIFETVMFGKREYFVIEIKDGDRGSNIRQSNKIFSKYLLNYISGKTEYFVNSKKIEINRFLVATQNSPNGFLFSYGDKIVSNEYPNNNYWLGKNVPRLEFSRTKDFGRSILQDYSNWRKVNKYKNGPAIGWLVSDIIINFTEKELKTQKGMVGIPLIQGVNWNTKLNRWGQFFTTLWKK
jgi:hypothetical protein